MLSVCVVFPADPAKPVVTMATTTTEDLSSPATATTTANKRTTHHTSDDVFSRLDNRRDGVFSRLDTKRSIKSTADCHDDSSNEVTSQALDTTQDQQQQPITTVISKRRIKLTDIKDNIDATPSSHVTTIHQPTHQPPTNKVVGCKVVCVMYSFNYKLCDWHTKINHVSINYD